MYGQTSCVVAFTTFERSTWTWLGCPETYTSDTTTTTDTPQAAEITWIPVQAPAQVSGAGLDQAKVGMFTRPDGKQQVTYNGHQLYRFAGDRAPGEAKGQGVNDKYFLIGQNGEPAR